MDINKQIIDQRVGKIFQDNPDWFEIPKNEEHRKKQLSKAFLIFAAASYLEIESSESVSYITEGGNDSGVDAIYIGDISDSEFTVILFQSKYHFDLEKEYHFPANALLRTIDAIKNIFNPHKTLLLNDKIKPFIEEIRSLILDGYIPNIKSVLLSNGEVWQVEGDNHIKNANFPKNQVSFQHYNHQDIVRQLQNNTPIKDAIRLSGKAIIENFAFKRVLVGKVSVNEIAGLMERHGENLLEKNIRKYLGLHKSRINEAIQKTLVSEDKRNNFYFFNNGITMLCSQFRHNELMDENWQVKVDDIQIINGGQTSRTIRETIKNNPNIDFSKVFVLLRLYEVSTEDEDTQTLTTDITIATNSQNPVDLRDLRANDEIQKKLKIAIEQLGYHYITKRGERFKGLNWQGKGEGFTSIDPMNVPSSVASEAVFAIWKRKPHLAKFKRAELFGKFYEDVFEEINASQLLMAVFIFRYCDNQRRKEDLSQKYNHIPYSNYFIAMLVGNTLLKKMNISFKQLTHKNFKEVKKYFDQNNEQLFQEANQILVKALEEFFPVKDLEKIDLRRISALFRRGDLLSILEKYL
ncbi:MAG: AIPR family protein [Microscillaceae bacterium]|jgi:hypothetical protein|nr:AIPR family protein [Microscillaceae bacterium]